MRRTRVKSLSCLNPECRLEGKIGSGSIVRHWSCLQCQRFRSGSSAASSSSSHILHFNATFHPTSAWVMQQLREAFPYDTAPRNLVFDRDSIFSSAVVEFIKGHGRKACSHLLSQSLAKRNR